MCGPIAFALPVHQRSAVGRFIGNLLYQLGRISGYALIGLLFGLLGKALLLSGLQQRLSLVAGLLMLAAVLFPKVFRKNNRLSGLMYKGTGWLKQMLGSFLRKKSFQALFLVGFLNAFLPCGLVYFALVGALSTGDLTEGMLYMMFFGLGTLPVMLSTMFAKDLISLSFRNTLQRMVPYMLALMGILFVLRGLGLGIPYISPTNGALTIDSTIPCH
jgi:hypothetical protein